MMAMAPGEHWKTCAHTGRPEIHRGSSSVRLETKCLTWMLTSLLWHRLVPLSEGRIEESNGTLMCSFHGWTFDGEGNCINIPQVHFVFCIELKCMQAKTGTYINCLSSLQQSLCHCMHVPLSVPVLL